MSPQLNKPRYRFQSLPFACQISSVVIAGDVSAQDRVGAYESCARAIRLEIPRIRRLGLGA
jgi:hypothetical protein